MKNELIDLKLLQISMKELIKFIMVIFGSKFTNHLCQKDKL